MYFYGNSFLSIFVDICFMRPLVVPLDVRSLTSWMFPLVPSVAFDGKSHHHVYLSYRPT